MNCSLRIITFVEKKNINTMNVQVLTEAAELLMILYKCPNNSVKSVLGLYVITLVNLLKVCCSFVLTPISNDSKGVEKHESFYVPFHKLEKYV